MDQSSHTQPPMNLRQSASMPRSEERTPEAYVSEMTTAANERMLMASRLKILAILLCIGAFALLFPFPVDGRIWAEVFNLGHAPFFGGLLLLIVGLQDPAAIGLRRVGVAVRKVSTAEVILYALIVCLLGAAGEVAQKWFGRSASWGDVAANCMGVSAAAAFVLGLREGGVVRGGMLLIAAGLMGTASWEPIEQILDAIAQERSMPVLSSMERTAEIAIWYGSNSELKRSSEWSTDGDSSLRIQMHPGQFSGASIIWAVPDWSAYRGMTFDIFNAESDSLTCTVKIFDQTHRANGFDPDDRFESSFTALANSVISVTVDLTEVRRLPNAREMNLSEISGVEWFTTDLKKNRVVYIDNIRLHD